MSGQVLKVPGTSVSGGGGGGGTGDVIGVGVPVSGNIPVYVSEDKIEDSGASIADVIATAAAAAPQGDVVGPASVTDSRVALFDGASGKLLKDAGQSVAEIIAAASAAPPPSVAQNSFLVRGGAIIWTSAYNFRVSAAEYYIAGVDIQSVEQTITLANADPTNDRIDVIAVDNTGTVIAVQGTAAAQPSEPDVDPSTQLKLGVVLVSANSTAPANVSTSKLWEEQAGSPTEWNWTSSGSGWTIGSLNNPHGGTKCIEGTNVAKSAYVQGQIGSGTIDPNAFDTLILYIRSKATWPNNRTLKVQWYTSGAAKGKALTIADGQWGFDSSITNTYQLLVLPMAQFSVPVGTLVNQLRITDTNGAIGFYLDDISIQQGLPSDLAISALTLSEADARYAKLTHASTHQVGGADPLIVYKKVGLSIDGNNSPLSTGVKGQIQVDFAGIIVGWSIVADQAGSITIEIDKKAGTQTAPAVPNTTTDKISASAPISLSSAQTGGVGASGVSTWTTAVNQWDTLQFNVTAASTLTRVQAWLRIQVTGL